MILLDQGNYIMEKQWIKEKADLERAIRENLEHNQNTVRINALNHSAIASVLRTFVYDPKYQNSEISIVFSDNSISLPFPIGYLPPIEYHKSTKELPLLNLGLISLQDSDLDYFIDFYILQNEDIYQKSSAAEMEKYSYQETINLLNDPIFKEGGIIELYHREKMEKYEAIVVGYYRGIVSLLQERIKNGLPRSLIFQPKYVPTDKPLLKTQNTDDPKIKKQYFEECEPWY